LGPCYSRGDRYSWTVLVLILGGDIDEPVVGLKTLGDMVGKLRRFELEKRS
jgi:hypothetical protein